MQVDYEAGFIHFDCDAAAVGKVLGFEPLLGQWKHFVAISRLELDLLLRLPDVDERAGDQLMLAFLTLEVHVDDVIVFIEFGDDFVSCLKRLVAVPPRHVRIDLMVPSDRRRHHERSPLFGDDTADVPMPCSKRVGLAQRESRAKTDKHCDSHWQHEVTAHRYHRMYTHAADLLCGWWLVR